MLLGAKVEAGRKNPEAAWKGSLDKLMVANVFEKKQVENPTLEQLPGIMLQNSQFAMCDQYP